MNCLEFERRLDAGELATLGNAAIAHTHECARCTQALARARRFFSTCARSNARRATMRYSHVPKLDSPRNPGSADHTRTNASCATSSASDGERRMRSASA